MSSNVIKDSMEKLIIKLEELLKFKRRIFEI